MTENQTELAVNCCPECRNTLKISDQQPVSLLVCAVCGFSQQQDARQYMDAFAQKMMNAFYARGVTRCMLNKQTLVIKMAMRADALMPLFIEYGKKYYRDGYIRDFTLIEDENGLFKYRTVYTPSVQEPEADISQFEEIVDFVVNQTRKLRPDLSDSYADFDFILEKMDSSKINSDASSAKTVAYQESTNPFALAVMSEMIHQAVTDNDLYGVKLLLKAGAPLKILGHSETLVGAATENLQYEMLRLLLSKGALPHYGWEKPHKNHHLSPLLRAAELGDVKLVSILLSHAAYPDKTCSNTGFNALEIALIAMQKSNNPSSYREVVDFLKSSGFKVDRGFAVAAMQQTLPADKKWLGAMIGLSDGEMEHVAVMLDQQQRPEKYRKPVVNNSSGQDFSDKRLSVIRSLVDEKSKESRIAQLLVMQIKGIGVRPIPDIATLHAHLDRDFPWFSQVTKIFIESLNVKAQGSGEFHLPPVILLGDPGIGKTAYCSRLAELSNVPFKLFGLGGSMSNQILAGTERGWETAKPSMPLQMMMDHQIANPLIMLDEIDKAGGSDRNGHPHHTLLGLLEPSSSKNWSDPFLMGSVDMSRVSWIATANSIAQMPRTLLSRFRVMRVETPGIEHYPAIVWRTRKRFSQDNGLDENMLPLFGDGEWAWLEQHYKTPRSVRQATEMLLSNMLSSSSPRQRLN